MQTVNSLTTNYLLDLNTGLTQVLSDGTNTYLYGNGRIGELQPGGWQYHLGDALGSVRQLADAGGAVTLARSYEPYGSVLSSAGGAATMYGFTGEAQSGGLVYLRARYYASGTGRFLTRDTWKGNANRPMSYNAWLYSLANPVHYTDPTGHTPWTSENIKAIQALKSHILSSAQRHNRAADSLLTNEAFAALMAAYLNRESRLGGISTRDLTTLFRNTIVDPVGDTLANAFGYDATTGIANIRPSVGVEILRGKIGDRTVRGTGYEVCGSGYDAFIEMNTRYVHGMKVTPGDQDPALLRMVYKELQNQIISIEYLAANIERGVDKAKLLKVKPSIFNLGNWLWRGVMSREEYVAAWRRGQNWTTYGVEMIRDMPMAFSVLGLAPSDYNAYNPDEADFVDGSFFGMDLDFSKMRWEFLAR